MADSVNRIIPSTVAPERCPVSRRERGERNRKEPQQDTDKQKPFPVASAADTTSADDHDETAGSSKDKTKGKILDISA